MKKLSLFILCFGLSLYQLMAGTVSIQTAETVALNFYKGAAHSNSGNLSAVLKHSMANDGHAPDFYVFDIVGDKGFVIVAGYDNIQPVIGYSTESNFGPDYMQYGLINWMRHAADNIEKANANHLQADARIANRWASCLNGPYNPAARSGTVSPLTATTWDQSPNYNALCPYNAADNQRAVTGCVATSMAQIMKYWNYPASGTGSYTYDDTVADGFSFNYGVQTANFNTNYAWTSMPNSVNGPNTAVATLMYHCGVSVAMDYGDNNQGGSGAWVNEFEIGPGQPCSELAFKTYFKYDPNSIQGLNEANYNSAQWISLIKTDLDNGMPILYDGDDVNGGGGHAWVCDGYDANDMVHMNWGWSGQSNGYFAVNNLSTGQYNFSSNEGALIGIQPLRSFSVSAAAQSPLICHGGSTALAVNGPATASYTWVPATGLSCSNCAAPIANPTSTTTYFVTADSAGVQVTSTVTVAVASTIKAGFQCDVMRACSAPATFTFNNTSLYGNNYVWDFGDSTGSTDTTATHTYQAYGQYVVKLRANGVCGTDTFTAPQLVEIYNIAPIVQGQSVCNGQPATLNASTYGNVYWYGSDTGRTVLQTGPQFITPGITANTTFYAEAQLNGTQQHCGPQDNTIGGGGNFSNQNEHGLLFTNTRVQRLVSVDVFAQGGGDRIITLYDSAQNVLHTATVFIPNGSSTVTLNFDMPVQAGMKLACGGNVNLYRNNAGAVYPYHASDNSLSITGSDAGSAGYYYYFYNWQLNDVPCISSRVPVVVTVMNGAATFSYQTANTTVAFNPTVNTATTYAWDFGDGQTSSQPSPSHTYANSGAYTVQLVESNGACSDTSRQTILAATAGIANIALLQDMRIYPNPAKEQVTIQVNVARAGTYKLQLFNMLGESLFSRELQMVTGANTLTEDISRFASGVYLLSLGLERRQLTVCN